jgi:hypothetical protein
MAETREYYRNIILQCQKRFDYKLDELIITAEELKKIAQLLEDAKDDYLFEYPIVNKEEI